MMKFMKIKNEEENTEKENEDDDPEFENENNEDANEASDLSILEKEENLKPHITEKLEKFSNYSKKFRKLREQFIELNFPIKKLMLSWQKKLIYQKNLFQRQFVISS